MELRPNQKIHGQSNNEQDNEINLFLICSFELYSENDLDFLDYDRDKVVSCSLKTNN
jgi:hypothetical protein